MTEGLSLARAEGQEEACSGRHGDDQNWTSEPRVSKPTDHAGAVGRGIRVFAVLAAFLMVSVAFGVIVRPGRAQEAGPTMPGAMARPGSAVYSEGTSVALEGGSTVASTLATFQRWDGPYLSASSLNLSNGNWPYLLRQDASSFTITRLGDSFTQAKVPGAIYEFRPDGIKETLVLSSSSSAPNDAVGIGFGGSYLPYVTGAAVTLIDRNGEIAWTTEPFAAHDSSPTPRVFPNPVRSVSWSLSGLTINLDPTMVTWAQYPLYIDPTWVLKGTTSNGWTGTLDGVTNDRGDANLRLGVLADNFNDNANEVWTVTSGNSFSLSGGRASLKATEVHASGSWYNLTLSTTVNFASCGASNLMLRYASSSNQYYLKVDFAGKTLRLYKVINGVTTALSSAISVSMSKNTNYDVKVVARGNAFEVWWAGVRKWSGTDPSPPGTPISGNVGISETTSGCTMYVDNVRARDPAKWSGNYTSVKRGATGGNVATQVRFLGSADAYNATDFWINSSANNDTWGGWHLVKSMAAPGTYYPIPDIDRKQYYQVRAVLRTGLDGTPSISEIDVTETAPGTIIPTTNTGDAPWYAYVDSKVNSVSGNLFLTLPGLSIPSKGGPITIAPTYNSARAAIMGPFGLGTMDAYHEQLSFPGGGNVNLTAGDGAVYTFVTMGGNAYSPPPGIHDNLIKKADGTYTLWQPDGSRANFDATGKLTSLMDRNGNHWTLTYTSGNPTRIADDSGLALTLAYSSGRVSSITDPAGRHVTYVYDGSGRLTQVVDPMGFTSNYTYTSASRLNLSQDRAGHVDHFVYDGSGRVNETWIGEWNYVTGRIRWQVKQYALTFVSGTQTTVRNALGGVTTITVNSQGNPTNISGPAIGCALCSGGNSTAYAWDGEFDRLTVTDGRGSTTSYSYDWMGNVLTSKDPGGNMTAQTYANVANTTQFISLRTATSTPSLRTTRYTYYANGNLNATIQPGGNTSRLFYDLAGSVTRSQDFRLNSITYGYDSHEFQVNSTDAGGNRTTYQNDRIGRTWNVTSPGGNVTRRVYDLDSRVTSATDPMGNTTQYAYDKEGRQTKATDPYGLWTTYIYNVTFGTINRTISTNGNTTWYAYDNAGDQVKVIDTNTHVTRFVSDAYRRVVNQTTPLGHTTRFVYDGAGNLVVKTEPNGTVIRYTYDRSNRLKQTTYPNGQLETVTYDQDGNVIEKKGSELDEFFTYDVVGRVKQTRQVFLDAALTFYHNYTYDANGNRAAMSGNGGGTYLWNKNNQIWIETDSVGNRWTYSYGKDGQLLKETYPNGGYVKYAYDRDGRLVQSTSYRPGGAVQESFGYVYDKLGNVISQQNPATTQGNSSWYQVEDTSTTWNLTAAGLSPSPQSVTVTVGAAGIMVGGEPGMPDTGYVRYYYILNGGSETYLGMDSYTLTGHPTHFSGAHSGSVSVHNGDRLLGEIVFSSNSGGSAEGTTSLSVSILVATNPTAYQYDREYRLLKATYPDGSFTKYTYDAVGNRLTVSNGATTVTSSYNADNELTSSTDGTTYTYDANGNELTRTLGDVTIHFAYDYANEPAPISTTRARATSSWTYCSGGDEGCTATLTMPTLLPSAQSVTVTFSASVYEYDANTYPPYCPSSTVYWYYVLNGVQTLLGSQTLSLNSKWGDCEATFSKTFTPTLTLHTNDTLYEIVSFENDAMIQSEVVSMSVSTAPLNVAPYVAIQYGPGGLAASETVNRGSVTQHYDYDLLGMGGLPQRVATYNGTALDTQYFYGVGSDRPLDLIRGGVSYYYHRDALSSTTTITDASGTNVANHHYDAYGNLMAGSSDTVGNPLRYAGREWDSTTGLIYERARFYDPSTGRFLTPDPLGGGYAYAGDNPVNFVDPTGMRFTENDPYYNWHTPNTAGTTTRSPGHDYGGGDYASGSASTSGGVRTGPSGSVWTERCTASLFLFLVAAALTFAGIFWVDPGIFRAVWNAQTSWAIGGSWAAATGSPWTLLGLVISIGWFIISSMDFWSKIAAGIAFGSSFIPLKMALTFLVFGIQVVVLLLGLHASNCI
jgi:RHS repeat-associated protein